MALQLTKDNFQEVLASGKPVVIDFWAEWCGPCRMIGPLIEELATEYADRVAVCKCDVDSNDDIAAQYSVRNIPTVVFIKDGKVIDKQVGATTKAALAAKIEKLF
ncbi:MAG: thioredoxin [Mucinivorans sp.]